MIKKKFYSVEEASKLEINEIKELYFNFINPNQTKIFSTLPFGNELFVKAEGIYLYTSDGKKIYDFTGGGGVLGLGHNHPRILQSRINFQLDKKTEVHKIIFSKYMAALSSSLAYLLPKKLNKSFFLNSGAEAIEAAIKISYKFFDGNRKFILHSDKSYHGKLIASGSISGQYKSKHTLPLIENTFDYKFNDEKDLENKINECMKKGGVYAVVIEPFSASLLEPHSQQFMEKLFELKKKYNFIIIFDEVFTGFYKSKKMFYFQNYKKIEPDLICLSKTLGGGKSSISAIVTNDDVYAKVYKNISDTFLHTTTYNAFGEESVTALEALNIINESNFEKEVSSQADLINQELIKLKNKHKNKIKEIKGTGILNGIIFDSFLTPLTKFVEKIPIKFINNKVFFMNKLTATAISSELYKSYNILTYINDSSVSNHLVVSPSLKTKHEDIKYFFNSLDDCLNKNINLKTIELIFDFLKSNFKL